MAGRARERLGSTRDESRWCLEGNDGDRCHALNWFSAVNMDKDS